MVKGLIGKSNFIFEISNLNYPGIYVHVASNSHLGGLWGQMTSEVTSDLKIELSDLDYLGSHASLAYKGFLEMIDTDNKQQRPIMIHRVA